VNLRTAVLPGTSPPLSSDGYNLLSISTAHYSRSAADSQQHGYVCIFTASNPRLFGADKRADFLTPQFIVTEPGVVSAVADAGLIFL
jgi:hypothetical protein